MCFTKNCSTFFMSIALLERLFHSTPEKSPSPFAEILQVISEYAYQKKAVHFMLTSRFEMGQYGDIIRKMMGLGNIQFRQLSGAGEFFALTRDAEEVILGPATDKEGEEISVVSNQTAFSILYSQFMRINSIFLI